MTRNPDRLSKEEHQRIFNETVLPRSRLETFTPQEHPKAVILAGQPGAGKGSLARAVRREFNDDIFAVDPDEQREFHPDAKRWQQQSPYGWSQQTNEDASAWAKGLREAGVSRQVNLLVDTTLGGADGAIQMIRGLQAAGYEVEIRVMAAHRLESEHGIDFRFTDKIDLNGYARDVPLTFHDKVYTDLPGNVDVVGTATNARVRIYDRSLNELYDSRRDIEPASVVLREARDARLHDPEVTQSLRGRWQAQADWHRTLSERIVREEIKLTPATADALQHEQRERGKVELSAQRVEAAATLDELVRPGAKPAHTIPEPANPYPRLQGLNLGLAAEAAVTAYEWNETRQRAQVFANTLHNDSAARDAYVRQGAQTGGALVGTAVGGGAAVALGAGTGGSAVLVTGSAYLFATAAEHGVNAWQKQQVYNIHSEGVDWKFNGKQWIREDLRADLVDDGQDVTRRQDFAAPPDKARELSAAASAKAVEQALGAVPEPRNPFVPPAMPTAFLAAQ